jgi:hypothetical protein
MLLFRRANIKFMTGIIEAESQQNTDKFQHPEVNALKGLLSTVLALHTQVSSMSIRKMFLNICRFLFRSSCILIERYLVS